jgi:hypothetical protein
MKIYSDRYHIKTELKLGLESSVFMLRWMSRAGSYTASSSS